MVKNNEGFVKIFARDYGGRRIAARRVDVFQGSLIERCDLFEITTIWDEIDEEVDEMRFDDEIIM